MRVGKYSAEFKSMAVEKLINRGSRPVSVILEETGITAPTLYQWRRELAIGSDMKKQLRPHDRSPEEKLRAVNEFFAAPEESRGELLRSLGVHKEHIEEWQRQVFRALKHEAMGKHAERSERAEDRRKIRELESDLKRKNAALAEATALLVLKKKADLIWGTGVNE